MTTPDQNEARVAVHDSEIISIKADILELRADYKEVKAEIHEMRTDLARRPTWLIVGAFTFLSSALVGCLVFIAQIN